MRRGLAGELHMVLAKRVRKMEKEINMPLTGLFWLASGGLTQQHMHTHIHISYTFPIHQDSLYTKKAWHPRLQIKWWNSIGCNLGAVFHSSLKVTPAFCFHSSSKLLMDLLLFLTKDTFLMCYFSPQRCNIPFGINLRFIYQSCIMHSFLMFLFIIINFINVGFGINTSIVPSVSVIHCQSEEQ